MATIQDLLRQNRDWANGIRASEPEFFCELAKQQAPKFLWIGCSDSRVPANQIVGLRPGEVFVHRNVANLVVHTDFNCLSVIQFAVEILKVEHVLVVGHYGCGGVEAAFDNRELGLIDNWLRYIRDTYTKNREQLQNLPREEQLHRLCELNVIEQVFNLCRTTIVQDAWKRGQSLQVHGWVYSLEDGIINDLGVSINGESQVDIVHDSAVMPKR